MSKTIFEDDILAALQKYFNYKSLRPGQQPIIQNILRGKDIVVSMESGFGKSVCYQLAGLLRDGVVVVVSHSSTRMEEKSTELSSFKTVKTVCLINEPDVKAAGDLRNDLTKKRDIIQKLKGTKAAGAARVKFLFTTFDCLGSTSLKETLIDLHKNKLLQIFVVDAAYSKYPCLSDKKNSDFDSIKNTYHNIPIVCLVDPISSQNLSKIEKLLRLKNTYIVNEPSVQSNLTFKVMYRNEYPLEITKLITFLRKDYSKKRGIIYCDDENEFKALKKGCVINLRQWSLDDIGEISLCTSEDEPSMKDIDFVVHTIMPASLDLYLHQVFKSSRSSSKCDCILFYHVDDFDRVLEKSKKKIQQATAEHKDDFAKSLIKTMDELFDIIVYAENISICRQIFLLQYLNSKNYALSCGQCDSCDILKPGFIIEISDILRKILMAIWTINRQQRKRSTKKSLFNANLNSVISVLLGNVEKSYENTWVTKEWFFGSFGSWEKSILSLFIFTLLAKNYLQMNHFYDEQYKFSQNLIITTEGQNFVKSNSQHNLNISMKNSNFVKWTDPTSIEVQLYADLLSAAESHFKHTNNAQIVQWYMYFIEQLYFRIPSTWDEYKLIGTMAVNRENKSKDRQLIHFALKGFEDDDGVYTKLLNNRLQNITMPSSVVSCIGTPIANSYIPINNVRYHSASQLLNCEVKLSRVMAESVKTNAAKSNNPSLINDLNNETLEFMENLSKLKQELDSNVATIAETVKVLKDTNNLNPKDDLQSILKIKQNSNSNIETIVSNGIVKKRKSPFFFNVLSKCKKPLMVDSTS